MKYIPIAHQNFQSPRPSERLLNAYPEQVKKYMLDLQFTLHTIEYSKPQYIRKIIKEFDNKLWHEDLQLILYREYKHVIHDEQDLYDNSAAATTLFRARTATLKLNIERRHTDGYTNCSIYVKQILQKT